MRRPTKLSLPAVASVALTLPLLPYQNGAANVHGVEQLRIVPATEAPVYDLERIEAEVADTIRRTW